MKSLFYMFNEIPMKYPFYIQWCPCIKSKSLQNLTSNLLFGPTIVRSYEFSVVRPSVCLSVLPSVRPAFSRNWIIGVFWFFAWRSVRVKKWQSPIFQENSGFANFRQKWPKNKVFALYQKIEPWNVCSKFPKIKPITILYHSL